MELSGLIILAVGVFIYNEILVLRFCGLDKGVKKLQIKEEELEDVILKTVS
jgi:hypothetical protein